MFFRYINSDGAFHVSGEFRPGIWTNRKKKTSPATTSVFDNELSYTYSFLLQQVPAYPTLTSDKLISESCCLVNGTNKTFKSTLENLRSKFKADVSKLVFN